MQKRSDRFVFHASITVALAVAVATSATLPVIAGDTYLYKVQYLESSGAQYIDTGVVPTASTMVRVKYEYLEANGSYDMIAGCTSQRFYPISLNSKDPLKERHVYNGDAHTDYVSELTSHVVVFNDAQHRVFKDGRLVVTYNQTFTTTRSCYLFASNNSGSPNYYSTARIYWIEFIDSSTGEVLRRFIPVVADVDGAETPAMFDEANEKLYFNLGSGADFTAGPLKADTETPWYFVEYLESDGNQWIDTGYFATANTQTDVGYKFADESQAQYAMICGAVQAKRHYPVSIQNKDGKKERYVYGDEIFYASYPALQHHEVVFNDGAKNIFVDGKYVGTGTKTIATNTTHFTLFAAGQNGGANYKSKSRIYHCEMYESGDLQRAFVPAVMRDANGDPVPCMYERCGETNHYNKGAGAFTVGRIISHEVPLDLSAREDLADGLKVFSFDVRPSFGTVFTLDSATAALYDAKVMSDGVYLAAKGTGGDAANVIVVTGSTSAQFATNAMPTCASVVLRDVVTLSADCDWTGLGTLVIPDGVTIDLAGNKLHLSGFTCLPDDLAVITDSVGGGELHVTVAENDVLLSDRVTLGGSLRLVKHGAGVFVAAKMQQPYTGGTDVAEGVLRVANKDQATGYRSEIGSATSSVRIGPGAELNLNGYYNMEFAYTFDGGTLSSGISAAAYRQISNAVVFAGDGEVAGQNLAFMVRNYKPSTIHMNGNTLHVNLNSGMEFTICNANFVGDGVLWGDWGWVKIASNPCVGTNLTLSFPATHGGLWLDKNFTVSNFVSHTSIFYKGGDSTVLTVLGTYTPAEDGRTAFPNMVLADGSTIDLSGMDDVPTLPTSCSQVDGKTTHTRTISFEDNATINVKLGDRYVSKSVPIVGWETPPANIDGIKFKLVDGSEKTRIRKGSDGIYLVSGMIIMVR